MILKTIGDSLLVSLDSIIINIDDTLQALKGYKAYIIFLVH
jgi:hypothetical protein